MNCVFRRRGGLVAVIGLVLALGIGTAEAGARNLYAANFASDSVSVLDASTHQLLGPAISLPGAGPFGLAITPDGRTLFVTDDKIEAVSAIDTRTNRVVGAPIPVGKFPESIAITPDGSRAYVANAGSDSVSVIDTATNKVVGSPIKVGKDPQEIVITPDGSHAYVTNREASTVSVIDTVTNTVVGEPIKVGERPWGISVAPDGSRVYVANTNAQNVSVIDTVTNKVVGQPIKVGNGAFGVAFLPSGDRALVANPTDSSVSVIDVSRGLATATVTGLSSPEFLAVSPDGKTVFASKFSPGAVTALDTQVNQVLGTPTLLGADSTAHLAIVPDQPPVAMFSAPLARPGVPVSLDAGGSNDPDGHISTFAWSFGDRGLGTGQAPRVSHTYRRPGTYHVTLVLTDDEGCSTARVFTGGTALCNGSSVATATKTLKVSYPGVRVRCPASARPKRCHFLLRVVSGGRRLKAETRVARATVEPGQAAVVSLRPKRRFRAKIARAKRVRVEVRRSIGASQSNVVRTLRIVQ